MRLPQGCPLLSCPLLPTLSPGLPPSCLPSPSPAVSCSADCPWGVSGSPRQNQSPPGQPVSPLNLGRQGAPGPDSPLLSFPQKPALARDQPWCPWCRPRERVSTDGLRCLVSAHLAAGTWLNPGSRTQPKRPRSLEASSEAEERRDRWEALGMAGRGQGGEPRPLREPGGNPLRGPLSKITDPV